MILRLLGTCIIFYMEGLTVKPWLDWMSILKTVKTIDEPLYVTVWDYCYDVFGHAYRCMPLGQNHVAVSDIVLKKKKLLSTGKRVWINWHINLHIINEKQKEVTFKSSFNQFLFWWSFKDSDMSLIPISFQACDVCLVMIVCVTMPSVLLQGLNLQQWKTVTANSFVTSI